MWSYIFLILNGQRILIGPFLNRNDAKSSLNMLPDEAHSPELRAIPKKLPDKSHFEGAEVYSVWRFNHEIM